MNEPFLELPKEGDKVGAGRIDDLISVGGTSRVYRTWSSSLELYRAVKIMNPDAEPEIRERFATEARISSKLIHPNIVIVHNYGETAAGLPFIEMEMVTGQTLEEVLKQRVTLPTPVTLAVMIGILEALNYAHNISYTLYRLPQRGVMHRDIKPGNIVFSGGIPKLVDFGIARPVGVSRHTLKGDLIGSTPYLAPESCITGGDVDFRSDIYQIGGVMYECITGVRAYTQTDIPTIIDAIANGQHRPLDTSNRAAAIVNKCMELDPAKRYQTAADCLADVRVLYNALSPKTTPEEQIIAFLSGTTPPLMEQTAISTGNKRGRGTKTLKIAAIAVPSVLVAGLTIVGLTYLKSTPAPTTSANTVIEEPPQPPPTAAPITTPKPQPATPPQPKPTAATQTPPPAGRGTHGTHGTQDTHGTQPPITTEDAQLLINEAKSLLAQNNAQEALAKYQQALKTPSATLARGEIVKLSLYGTAKCNSILFSQNKIPRSNYEAAWKSVKNTYPAGTPEHTEAIKLLDNGAAE